MKKIIFLIFIFYISIFSQDKPKMMWFDATANWERLSNKDSITYYLDKVKEYGFSEIVVDIKPITGEVLYKSKIAPQMTNWNNYERPDFDFLKFFIEECHKRNQKVFASMNVFVGGHNYFDRGVVYQDKQDWQSINFTDSGMVPITELKHKYSAMLNPALKEVQDYELSIIKEVVKNYKDLDGIILDRVRFDGIESDFSNASKLLFEKHLGKIVKNFPDDIYNYKFEKNNQKTRVEGKLYKQWLEWRTSIIYKFFTQAKKEVKRINPKIIFGDYAGAWYPTYSEVGVNWASKKYDPSKEYRWATKNYKKYGYAEVLDLFTTGNYFFEVTKEEVVNLNKEALRTEAGMGKGKEYWYSVEGSAEIVDKVTMNAVPVYAGLYVDQYKGHPEQFKKAVQMCLEKSDGLMVFDIVHIINMNWWEYLK